MGESALALPNLKRLLDEVAEREYRGNNEIGDVDHLGDLEVYGNSADCVCLLFVIAPLVSQVSDHLVQRVCRREAGALGLVGAIGTDRESGRRVEALGACHSGSMMNSSRKNCRP
jgi:hypothetical protein